MTRRTSRFVLAAVLTLVPATLAAQTEVQLKGGIGFSNVAQSGVSPGGVSLDNRTGFAAGFGVNYRFASILGLGFEGLYVQDGTKITSGTGTRDFKTGTISVPALLRLTIPTPGLRPYAFGGPQFNYQVSCTLTGGTCDDGRKKTSWAGVIGAGVVIGGKSGLLAEARYVYGLSDLSFDAVSNAKQRTLLLLAGFQF